MKNNDCLILLLLIFALSNCNRNVKTKNDNTIHQSIELDSLPIKDFVAGPNPPFKECHASTLVKLKDNNFLVAWFAGEKEKNNNVGIWMVKGKPHHWSAPKQVAKIRNDAHWNPVLFQSPEGKIFLFFKVGKEIEQWETWVKTSIDNGDSWSDAQELVKGDKGGRGPVRSKPIILSNGTWLAGASHEYHGYHVFTDRSEDNGKTWKATPYLQLADTSLLKKELIQPTLWESKPGYVHMLIRSELGIICRSDSKDYGKTWAPIYKTSLPNPNSGVDITQLAGNILILAYNPDNRNDGDRAPLLLGVSYDNGITWPHNLSIENGKGDDEFSYPGIISFGDTVAVCYTWQRKNIAFWMGTKKDLFK
jgi:predicted neuraminidase